MNSLNTYGDHGKTNYWLLIPLVLSWLAALLCIPSALYLYLWVYDYISGFGFMVMWGAIPTGLLALAVLTAYKTTKRVLENRWVASVVWCVLAIVLAVSSALIALFALLLTV